MQDLDISDFKGDEKAMIEMKLRHGIRKLSQEEKLLMFALVDKKFKDESNLVKEVNKITSHHKAKGFMN